MLDIDIFSAMAENARELLLSVRQLPSKRDRSSADRSWVACVSILIGPARVGDSARLEVAIGPQPQYKPTVNTTAITI